MKKNIILGIIIPILETLTLNYSYHISILNNLFNTKIFLNPQKELYLLGITLYFIILALKKTKYTKQELKIYKQKLPYLFLIFPILLPTIKNKIYMYLIPLIILFINNNKHQNNKLSLKNILSINIINLLTIFNIPILITTLLACKLNKLSKNESLKISLFIYIIYNIKQILLSSFILNINTLIGILTSFIITSYSFNCFLKLYDSNKLHKLSLFLIIIIIFNLYWFR